MALSLLGSLQAEIELIEALGIDQYVSGRVDRVEAAYLKKSPKEMEDILLFSEYVTQLFGVDEFDGLFQEFKTSPALELKDVFAAARRPTEVLAQALNFTQLTKMLEISTQEQARLIAENKKDKEVVKLWENRKWEEAKTLSGNPNFSGATKRTTEQNILLRELPEYGGLAVAEKRVEDTKRKLDGLVGFVRPIPPGPEVKGNENVAKNIAQMFFALIIGLGMLLQLLYGEWDPKLFKALTREETGRGAVVEPTSKLVNMPGSGVKAYFPASIGGGDIVGENSTALMSNPFVFDLSEMTGEKEMTGKNTIVTRDDMFAIVQIKPKGGRAFTKNEAIHFRKLGNKAQDFSEYSKRDKKYGVTWDYAKPIPIHEKKYEFEVIGYSKTPVQTEFDEGDFFGIMPIKVGDFYSPYDPKQTNADEVLERGLEFAMKGMDLTSTELPEQLPKESMEYPATDKTIMVEYIKMRSSQTGQKIDPEDIPADLLRLLAVTVPKQLLKEILKGGGRKDDATFAFFDLVKLPALGLASTLNYYSNVKREDQWLGFRHNTWFKYGITFLSVAIPLTVVGETVLLMNTEDQLDLLEANRKEQVERTIVGAWAGTAIGLVMGTTSAVEGVIKSVGIAIAAKYLFGGMAGLAAMGSRLFITRLFSAKSGPGGQQAVQKRRRSSSTANAKLPSQADIMSALRASNGDTKAAAKMLSSFSF